VCIEQSFVKTNARLASGAPSTWHPPLFLLFLIVLLVQISHLIEELVTVNRQLIDYLCEDRLDLHEGVETSAGLRVENVLNGFDDVEHRDLSGVFIVEEGHQGSCLVEGEVAFQTPQGHAEVLP